MLKEIKGYVSIETIVVVALILVLGVAILTNLFQTGKEITATSENQIYEAQSKYEDPGHGPIIDDPDYYN